MRAVAERYRAATRAEKLAILDEFVAVTGYHRKHAIRMVNSVAVDVMKERLRAISVTSDPLRLLDEIRGMQHHLAQLAVGATVHTAPSRDADLDAFMKGLATAWRDGEVRPTHRKEPRPRRDWRTRVDPFESAWPRVILWLEAEPDRTAKELLARLQTEGPDEFADGQLRTLQRKMKTWRAASARRLLFSGEELMDSKPADPKTSEPSAISLRQAGSIPS